MKRENRIEEQVQMSKIEVPIDQIKALPAIGGEVDLLKSLQLLPGVQSGVKAQVVFMFAAVPPTKTSCFSTACRCTV